MKTNCGGGLKAPSCHYCYSKYGTRSCGGDCEYNPYIGRCEKSKCLVLSRKKSKYRHPKITERHVKMIKITKFPRKCRNFYMLLKTYFIDFF